MLMGATQLSCIMHFFKCLNAKAVVLFSNVYCKSLASCRVCLICDDQNAIVHSGAVNSSVCSLCSSLLEASLVLKGSMLICFYQVIGIAWIEGNLYIHAFFTGIYLSALSKSGFQEKQTFRDMPHRLILDIMYFNLVNIKCISQWRPFVISRLYDTNVWSILINTLYPLLPQVAKEFGFNSNGFSVYQNRNKTGEILSQNKTLSLLKIK